MARAGRGFPLQPRWVRPTASSAVAAAAALSLVAVASCSLTYPVSGSGALDVTASTSNSLKFATTGTAAVSLTAAAVSGAPLTTTGAASITLTAQLAVNPVQLVQKIGTANGGGTNTTTLTITAGAGTTTGNAVIVAVQAPITGTATVTDQAGNTYTLDAQQASPSTFNAIRVFSCRGITGLAAGQTITITWSAGLTFQTACAYEFSGLSASGPVDTAGTGSGSGGTGTISLSSPFTTTGLSDLQFVAVAANSNGIFTPGTGATALDSVYNSRTLFTEYKTGVTAGTYSGTGVATSNLGFYYGAVLVAYLSSSAISASAQISLTASAVTSPTSFTTTGSASITLTALTNAQPVTGTAGLDLFAVAVPTLRVTATATAGLSLTGFAVPTQTHIPVETDLTFRVSTDDLIVDAAVTSLDAVTSITGMAGDKRQLGTDTTITADLTDNSQLAGYNAGQAKAVHLYRLKSKPRKNAPTISLNAAPTAPKVNGDGTIGAGTWVTVGSNSPTAYQAAVAVDISDLILLSVVPPGGGDSLVARYWVEGIRHQITADGTWSVSLNISRADETPTGGFWQLGQSRLGLETVLTW